MKSNDIEKEHEFEANEAPGTNRRKRLPMVGLALLTCLILCQFNFRAIAQSTTSAAKPQSGGASRSPKIMIETESQQQLNFLSTEPNRNN